MNRQRRGRISGHSTDRRLRSFRPWLESLEPRTLPAFTFNAGLDFGPDSFFQSLQKADLNRDGHLDLAVVSGGNGTGQVSIFLGNGKGTFQAPYTVSTDTDPQAVLVADVNGDGNPDLITANYLHNNVSVLLGNGNGTFQGHQDFPTGPSPMALTAGDFNTDGHLDLATVSPGNGSGGTIGLLMGNGNGTFQAPVNAGSPLEPRSVATTNLNGRLALVVTNSGFGISPSVQVFLGNGNGTFQAGPSYFLGFSPNSVAIADLNGDGKPDLAVADGSNTYKVVAVLLNNGNGTFSNPVNVSAGNNPSSVVVADLNHDGIADIATGDSVPSTTGYSCVLLGNGNGTFRAPITYATSEGNNGIVAGDFNGDANMDLVTANGAGVTVLLGSGNGAFPTGIAVPLTNGAEGVTDVITGDFNNDHKTDMVAIAGGPVLYLGNGNGTFQPLVGVGIFQAQSVQTADCNGDGNLDLVVLDYNQVNILLGNGDGTFRNKSSYSFAMTPGHLAVADLNGDHHPDLIITNGSNFSVLLGNGNGTFQTPVNYSAGQGPGVVVVADFNGDGKPDVAIDFYTHVAVFLNNGSGAFSGGMITSTGNRTNSLVSADFNGDGKADLADIAAGNQVQVLQGNGDGTFRSPANSTDGELSAGQLIATDFTGDGRPDLAVENSTDDVSVFMNNGDGTFQSALNYVTPFSHASDTLAAGDFNNDGSMDMVVGGISAQYLSLVINNGKVKTATTTVLSSSSADLSVFGQEVTFTATVSPQGSETPTGTITFLDGAATLGASTLGSGSAVFTTSTLAVGIHPITAVYGGDANFLGSTSGILAQTVQADGSVTALVSTANPSVFGQSVTLVAVEFPIAPGSGVPTGTVTFKSGAATLGTGTLKSSGIATLTISSLAVGTQTLSAAYAGDTNFKASTSATLIQTVNRDKTATLVLNAVNPSVFGQELVFITLVGASAPGAGTPTGTVTFKDGAATLGTATLSNGRATLTRFGLSVGKHPITVSYAGDTNFLSSTSAMFTQTVNPANSIATVTTSVNPSAVGQTVTFTATVNPLPQGSGTPTGTVIFDDHGVSIGSGTLKANANGTGSTATFSTSSLVLGTHPITVIYPGDTNFKTSTSATLTQTVNAAASVTVLTTSVNASALGQRIPFAVVVRSQSSEGMPGVFGGVLDSIAGVWIGGERFRGTDTGTSFGQLGKVHRSESAFAAENLATLDEFIASSEME